MDSILNTISRFGSKFIREMGEVARELDGTGWAVISGVLLVCGWFFLKGNKIRST